MQEAVAVSDTHESQLNELFNQLRFKTQKHYFIGQEYDAWNKYIEQNGCDEGAKRIVYAHLEEMIASGEAFPDIYIALALKYGFYDIASSKLASYSSFNCIRSALYHLLKSIAQHDNNAPRARTLICGVLNRESKMQAMQVNNIEWFGLRLNQQPEIFTEESQLPLISLAIQAGSSGDYYPLSVFLKEAGNFNWDTARDILETVRASDIYARQCIKAALLVGRSTFHSFDKLKQWLKLDYTKSNEIEAANVELETSLRRSGVIVASLLSNKIPLDVCYVIAGLVDADLGRIPLALWQDKIQLGQNKEVQEAFDNWMASKNSRNKSASSIEYSVRYHFLMCKQIADNANVGVNLELPALR